MKKERLVFFVFIIFILLLFLFYYQFSRIMDKKEGYLIKDKKYSVELFRKKNQDYADKIRINLIKDNKLVLEEDINNLNVWKLEIGDIDGDGVDEIALGVYTESPLHPVEAKRPFIYKFNGDKLIPKWRG